MDMFTEIAALFVLMGFAGIATTYNTLKTRQLTITDIPKKNQRLAGLSIFSLFLACAFSFMLTASEKYSIQLASADLFRSAVQENSTTNCTNENLSDISVQECHANAEHFKASQSSPEFLRWKEIVETIQNTNVLDIDAALLVSDMNAFVDYLRALNKNHGSMSDQEFAAYKKNLDDAVNETAEYLDNVEHPAFILLMWVAFLLLFCSAALPAQKLEGNTQ